MYLGKVIGSNWGAKQAEGLEGLKLLQVQPITLRPAAGVPEGQRRLTESECELSEQIIVAADTLGAGPGEYVLVAMGSRVRDIGYGSQTPIKAAVVAIVDGADIDTGAVR
jgi:ethanolamine utilization protein EutN